MLLEDRVKGVFKEVLDINSDEIKENEKLDQSLGIDSTEMVEVSVAIKKELGIDLAGNEIKKTNSFQELLDIVKSKVAQ